ncbi:hypothetical protein, partial [Enterovibrio norvegicus]|uniref:hypothetical protein n=1 Tax=Enterovibrio norvegicus TaxID=188144 RepID=UPI0004753334
EFLSMKITGTGFIACAHFEESICHYGEDDTPEKALSDFVGGSEFAEYCYCTDVEDNTHVEVKVFKAIYANTPEANMDDFEDGWEWILGEEVSSHQVLFLDK